MIIDNFYPIFGKVMVLLIIFMIISLVLTLILGKILIKKDVLIFPQIITFAIDTFYVPFKKFTSSLGFGDSLIDHIGVEVRNKLNKKSYDKISPKDKILVLPHCLRNPNCPAKLEESGLKCVCCKNCIIGYIKPRAEKIGFKVFIIPGSSFVKKIAKTTNFKAVLGVACYQDLNLAMMKLSDFSPQGVVLSRDGCFNTQVDVLSVLEGIGYKGDDLDQIPTDFITPCMKNKDIE